MNGWMSISAVRRLATAVACAVAAGILALAAIARAQPPEGARRKAEPLDTACDRCHSCAEPSPGVVCLRPCTRAERMRIAKEFSAKLGPTMVILDELENLYLPVAFDHAGHAEMGQMTSGCATCHHYTPEGSDHPACKTCHDIKSGQGDIQRPGLKGAYHRQCLSCHREWGGETGCGVCHRPKTATRRGAPRERIPTPDDLMGRMHPPIPEPNEELYQTQGEDGVKTKVLFRHRQHVERYGLRCAECHREDNCNRCHQGEKKHVQQVRSFDQHHKPCLQCHRTDKCESCHFAEGASAPPPFDHATTGWPLRRFHLDNRCRECHTTAPFARVDRACDSCHKNWSPVNFDHGVTGQALDENHVRADCDACHIERRFERPPMCDSCHEEGEGVSFPAKRPGPTRTIASESTVSPDCGGNQPY